MSVDREPGEVFPDREVLSPEELENIRSDIEAAVEMLGLDPDLAGGFFSLSPMDLGHDERVTWSREELRQVVGIVGPLFGAEYLEIADAELPNDKPILLVAQDGQGLFIQRSADPGELDLFIAPEDSAG